ncbi:protein of function [Leptolyngbya sp. Heron Island J]|uniref:Ycf51 family protein n=1 Tax=Leptolyngbya sp. Heron Island J TaxID=1385935 RepID=UPI0003B98031|nr:Ycf51 family protein [Leptolyngbya sp. Heron Island J]ESA36281.1 protein of function [Leptolyngbya sp. Heron Island J]
MPTPEFFLEATKWMGLTTLAFAALAALAFIAKWGIRFRLVGVTGFCGVLTAGLFGLSFQPLITTTIKGSVPYTTVYDSGAAQLVISVPADITDAELEATLQQAAVNSFNPSRLGGGGQTPMVRARTIVHRDPGISDLLYVGQIQPDAQSESGYSITLSRSALAKTRAALQDS